VRRTHGGRMADSLRNARSIWMLPAANDRVRVSRRSRRDSSRARPRHSR
jgi:hypothetical protein